MFYKGNEDREKRLRFSIRKVSFGAASVAVAALFMFPGNGTVSATEQGVTPTNEGRQGSPLKDPDVQNGTYGATPVVSQLDGNSGSSETTAPEGQEETTTPTPADSSSTSVESATASATEEVEEKATSDLDKKQLEDYVAEIDAKLASGSYATKTDESVATLKEHLELAKLALTTAKSQDELTKAYRRLFMTASSGLRSKPKAQVESPKLDTTEGKATVGKKANNTERATESNSIANSGKHDSRNGQALDRNNPFRTDGATTDTDPDAHQTYTAPSANASVEELVNALKTLPTTIINETKLASINEVGNLKGVQSGGVIDISEFGGWKAVEGGKFGLARKTEKGVFPIETANTVKVNYGPYRTYLDESSFDRSQEYILLLGKVRTEANKSETVSDGSSYREVDNGTNGNKGKGLASFKGIEKTFKAYSKSTGSGVTVSFRTGFTGDIDGNKARYKVEVLTKDSAGQTKIIYTETFGPSDNTNSDKKTVTPVNAAGIKYFNTNRTPQPTREQLNEKLSEDGNKSNLGIKYGTFTSKGVVLPADVTEYTVRISAADSNKLGMGYQVPWQHYALPVTGLEFNITQDTKQVAKALLKQAYDKLLEDQQKDEHRKTEDSVRAYQEKLAKIKELLASNELKNNSEYLSVLKSAVDSRDDLKAQTPSQPTVTADEPTASVSVKPVGEADKVEIGLMTDGGAKKLTASKGQDGTWSLDETPAGVSINAQTGEVTVSHTAVVAGSNVTAKSKQGNSDLSGESSVAIPAKTATPSQPTVTADEPTASVSVKPVGEADKVEIGLTTDGGAKKLTASKGQDGTWSLDETPAGVSINAQTGEVTVSHTAVVAGSNVTAKSKQGNSDLSGESSVAIPAKTATPSQPTVTADEPTASVSVKPVGEADKVEIGLTTDGGAKKLTASKGQDGTWSLDETPAGVSINAQTGEVTVSHTAVVAGSNVTAKSKQGNSDLSGESSVAIPAKTATPSQPTVTADEPTASVSVKPVGEADKVEIGLTTDGGAKKLTASKGQDGTWSLDETPAGVSINAQTGEVTVSHTAVVAGSNVTAKSKQGNSDLSGESSVAIPAKTATPSQPTVTADEPTASVSVKPVGEADKVEIGLTTDGGAKKLTASKGQDGTWSLDETPAGVSINAQTGEVTVSHTAVVAGSNVTAKSKQGNSDLSGESSVAIPAKTATPSQPTVTADEPTASVSVKPVGEADKVEIGLTTDGGAKKLTASKGQDGTWSLDETPAGVSINAQTGEVTVSHTAVVAGSNVTAKSKQGNSDLSGESSVAIPAKTATPSQPTVTADEPTASVSVKPVGEADKVEIGLTTDGGAKKLTASKGQDGTWSLDETPAGVSINAQTGEVTVSHTAVVAGSNVTAKSKQGNSDLSGESSVAIPAKTATPSQPTVTADEPTASVSVKPVGEADKVEIGLTTDGGAKKLTASKGQDGTWSLDETPAGVSINAQTGEVTVSHTAVVAGSNVTAKSKQGNSDLSGESSVAIPAKTATPSQPTVTADEPTASVSVKPVGEADKVEIGLTTDGGAKKLTASKGQDGTWSLDETPAGVSINAQTGEVTVSHTAVVAGSNVTAKSKQGNSDLSGESSVAIPAKTATPSQPTVTADEPTASVSVKPVGEADKVEIGLTTDGGAKKLTASKGQDGTWSLDETPAGVSINAQTGEVTVSHTAVVAGSNVTAKSKQGNSDLSGESSVAIPAKTATPSQPTVTADEPTASVSVKPVGEADKVEIGLTTDGGAKKLTASKGQDGTWSLDETPAGVSINAQTGEVTVSHTAVVAGSNVTAKSKQGNSDLSGESSVAIPAKTATPSQPTVTADEPTASVSVKPVGEADKVEIGLTTDGGAKKLTASKGQDGTWSLDETPAGVSINAQTGEVTVSHTAVVAGSNVTAKSKQGNSDLSGKGSAQMPIYRPAPLPRPIPVPDNGNTNSLVPSDLDGNQPGNAGDVNTTEPASPSVPISPSDSGQANSGQDGRSTDSGSTTTARSSVAPVTTTEPAVNTANREDDTVRSATQGQGTLDKSELSKQVQTLENLLKSLIAVSNPITDSARLVLAEAKKDLADDSLTEQGLRHILQTVKDAIASLESIKESQSATKAGEQKVSESAPEADKPVVPTQVPVGIIAASILVLLGLLFFLLARRNKESELEKLAKELSKLLKDSNLETVDKDVLENSQEELQNAVSFLADEKGSEHTEAELIDNLKEVIAKLKANA
ncbi:YSIRK-type signal peptide-containing protein [Streptococcus sp. Marseille-Q5855]|uniref:YSIRK-type signal peptide-containing protein n=1 Tax=Streptococcus sp. Marseille-Q5855 TaxID=2972781 RepID=UPI0021C59D40|nr:YSIRK-type signal peptide-containing protein [Streptococcus sp. Marseille-Q5855]